MAVRGISAIWSSRNRVATRPVQSPPWTEPAASDLTRIRDSILEHVGSNLARRAGLFIFNLPVLCAEFPE